MKTEADVDEHDLRFSAYCYMTTIMYMQPDGMPVWTMVPCKHYQAIAGLQDGICTKLKVPIEDYCKECGDEIGEDEL